MFDSDVLYNEFAYGFGFGLGASPPSEDFASHAEVWSKVPDIVHGEGVYTAPSDYAKSYSESMRRSYQNSRQRNELESGIRNFVGEMMHLGTTDIGPLLVSTLGWRVPMIVNTETALLNTMESAPGQTLFVDDWMYRCRQQAPGAKLATRMNPEAPLSTTLHQTSFSQKINVLSFWGDPISVSFVARAQNRSQGTGLDLLRIESDDEIRAIRKAVNTDLWNGTIQPNFTPPNVTEMGGLISRIITNTVDNGNPDVAAVDLEDALNLISLQINDRQCAAFLNRDKIGDVRVIEINRYGGSNQLTFQNYNDELARTFSKFKVKVDRIYDPDVGGYALPAIHDRDLPEGTAIIICIEPEFMPQFAYFVIDGQMGPWLFSRPVYDANETIFVMHGGTLDDTGEQSRCIMMNP